MNTALNTTLQLNPTSLLLDVFERALPECPNNGAVLGLLACGFCGSDLDKLRHPKAGAILGHELVGEILALGPEAQEQFPNFKIGQRIAVAHHVPCGSCHYCVKESPSMCPQFKATNIVPGGFSEQIQISAQHLAHTAFNLKESTPTFSATVIEPLACCLRAADRLSDLSGKTVAMIGLGFIGQLSSYALMRKGAQVYGLDLKAERGLLAKAQGWVTQSESLPSRFSELIHKETEGRGVDVVFLTVNTPATLKQAFELVRDGGTVMIFAGSGGKPPQLDQDVIYHREITVLSSYSPSLKHLQQANDLIQSGAIDVSPLLTETVRLADLPQAVQRYESGEVIKLVVLP